LKRKNCNGGKKPRERTSGVALVRLQNTTEHFEQYATPPREHVSALLEDFRTDDNVSKSTRKLAKRVLGLWSAGNAPELAEEFWEKDIESYGLARAIYVPKAAGSLTLAYSAAFDVTRPGVDSGRLFDVERQDALGLITAGLELVIAGGSIQAYDAERLNYEQTYRS